MRTEKSAEGERTKEDDGVRTSKMSVICIDSSRSATTSRGTSSTWPTRSVTRRTTGENSWVSEVMRLMIRPDWNWSKKDRP
jgi:hypothetical protein